MKPETQPQYEPPSDDPGLMTGASEEENIKIIVKMISQLSLEGVATLRALLEIEG